MPIKALPMKRVLRGLAAGALAALAACGGEEAEADAGIPPAEVMPKPGVPPQSVVGTPDDSLMYGCGGGVTGGGSGVIITSGGGIGRWRRSGPAPGPREVQSAGTDSAAAAEVFGQLERLDFRSIDHDVPGNWTCFLTLTDAGGTHGVAWPGPTPPPALRRLEGLIRRLDSLSREDRAAP